MPARPILHTKIIIVFFAAVLSGGCTVFQGGKLLVPESFGLTSLAPNIYVEPSADDATRSKLLDAVGQAEGAIRTAYGSVTSHPPVHACVSEECYRSFGGGRSVAKVYGDRILLSPRGLNWHFVAHEWSHAELLSRLTFRAWRRLPQWFDEGVAVAVSDAPEHSESHWQFLVANQIPHPSTEELHTFKSLRQWHDALERYGEAHNMERKAKGEPEIRPVYTAAGRELRDWLARYGREGLLSVIEQLNRGAVFETTYAAPKTAFESDVPPAPLAQPFSS